MQKQQVRMSKPATTAMAIRAQGGTVFFFLKDKKARIEIDVANKERSRDAAPRYSHGILSISFKNLLLISSNMSFLLISVLLEPEVSGTEVETKAWVGATVAVVVAPVAPVGPVGSAAAAAWGLLNNRTHYSHQRQYCTYKTLEGTVTLHSLTFYAKLR
ncbi:hypothetical protein EYF80_062034 [Liparis tanakae]|uniref:Uncharacterized protein n=1 Tax=Liparis tanakae TaxID=230148 RepID=A0A4Z2EGZ9_9TELE|nr:hypothetical protein EYF80_062034 [Liparis tanakae]